MKKTIAAIAITLALVSDGCVKQQPQQQPQQQSQQQPGWELVKSWGPTDVKHVDEITRRMRNVPFNYFSNLKQAEWEHQKAHFSSCVLQAELDSLLEEYPSLKGTHSGPQYRANCDATI